MAEKDYYRILRIDRHSPPAEIKRAFRELALLYHPDKNNNEAFAAAQFIEIHEAYRVLSNPGKRAAYDQRQWYAGNGVRKAPENNSPDHLIRQLQKLDRYIQRMQGVSVDREALQAYIEQILAGEGWKQLLQSNDLNLRLQALRLLMAAAAPLRLRQLKTLNDQMAKLANDDPRAQELIKENRGFKKVHEYWDKYRGLIIFVTTLVICFLIYLLGK